MGRNRAAKGSGDTPTSAPRVTTAPAMARSHVSARREPPGRAPAVDGTFAGAALAAGGGGEFSRERLPVVDGLDVPALRSASADLPVTLPCRR